MLKKFCKQSISATHDCQDLFGNMRKIYSSNKKVEVDWTCYSLKSLNNTLHQDHSLKVSCAGDSYHACGSRKYSYVHVGLKSRLNSKISGWLEDPCSVYLRSFTRYDRVSVFNLLSFLPTLYPKGYSWLDSRLDDVLAGRARCTLAVTPWDVAGVTIETPKGAKRLKLSTIYVNPRFRGLGVGASLLRHCKAKWEQEELSGVHVTADTRRLDALLPLLTNHGFSVTAMDKERYGPNRDEMIFNWEFK
jgi:GNAT superfamily N-acetyltransferase